MSGAGPAPLGRVLKNALRVRLTRRSRAARPFGVSFAVRAGSCRRSLSRDRHMSGLANGESIACALASPAHTPPTSTTASSSTPAAPRPSPCATSTAASSTASPGAGTPDRGGEVFSKTADHEIITGRSQRPVDATHAPGCIKLTLMPRMATDRCQCPALR